MFIEVKGAYGTVVCINVKHICFVYVSYEQTIIVTSDGSEIYSSEKIEDILRRIDKCL